MAQRRNEEMTTSFWTDQRKTNRLRDKTLENQIENTKQVLLPPLSFSLSLIFINSLLSSLLLSIYELHLYLLLSTFPIHGCLPCCVPTKPRPLFYAPCSKQLTSSSHRPTSFLVLRASAPSSIQNTCLQKGRRTSGLNISESPWAVFTHSHCIVISSATSHSDILTGCHSIS